MGFFSDLREGRIARPTEGTREATTVAPSTGGYQTMGTVTGPDGGTMSTGGARITVPGGNLSDEQFADLIRQAQMTAYGEVRPGQVEYYLQKRHSGEVMGNGQLADDQYWIDRATGMGAGGADAARFGPWAGGDDPNYGYGGGSIGTLGGMYNLGPGFSIENMTGGGPYTLSPVNAPGLLAPWTAAYTPPTETEDPGYAFRQKEGQQAIQRSAAAKGTLLTGGTLKDLAAYSQGLASQEYGAADARKFRNYQTAYGIYNNNQDRIYGKLMGAVNAGQNAAAQSGSFGSSYGSNASNLLTGIGNAQAAGQVGAGNAWQQGLGAFGNIGQMIALYPYLNK